MEKIVTVIKANRKGRTEVFKGVVVRHESFGSRVDLTIRNFSPAGIFYFSMYTDNPQSLWDCQTRGWAKYKRLTVEGL
jgi:phosphatidylserine decarboxylase